MRSFSGVDAKPAPRRLKSILLVGATTLALVASFVQPAAAQFFWDQPRMSPGDIAQSIMSQGYRPLSEPVRNDNIYVADAMDRRGRRERLIVSADSGQIVQRFYLEYGRRYRENVDPTIPRGPVPPGRIPDDPQQGNVFSRLFGGDDAAPPPDAQLPAPPPLHPRVRRTPRLADRTPETVRRPSPVESTPLAPAQASPAAAAPSAPAPSATAAPSSPAPAGDHPVRSIVRNPLSLPGTREDDDAAAASKRAAAAPPKQSTANPSKSDVPVAPLD